MYHALSLNGDSNIINAVKRQRNLGLQKTMQLKEELSSVVIIYKVDMFYVNDLTDQTW